MWKIIKNIFSRNKKPKVVTLDGMLELLENGKWRKLGICEDIKCEPKK